MCTPTKLVVAVLVGASAIFLQGCNEEAPNSSSNGDSVCSINAQIVQANPSVSVSWTQNFYYNASISGNCSDCCTGIKKVLSAGSDYSSLCAKAGLLTLESSTCEHGVNENGAADDSAIAISRTTAAFDADCCQGGMAQMRISFGQNFGDIVTSCNSTIAQCACAGTFKEGASQLYLSSQLYTECVSSCPAIELPPPGISQLCQPCAAGRFSLSGRGFCDSCVPGRWSATGATSCTACLAGTFSIATGASDPSTCMACAVGKSSSIGSSACTWCAPGRWSSAVVTTCEPCAAGRWSNLAGAAAATDCTLCGAGRWSSALSATSASTCIACSAGRWSSVAGAGNSSACEGCTAGRWSSAVAQTSPVTCQSCAAGTWSQTVGASSPVACTSCEAGRWQGSASSNTSCNLCTLGRFSITIGATSVDACKACLPGRFMAMQGASACKACLPGTFSRASAVSCTGCSPGYFQGATASTACDGCSSGSFSTALSATAVSTCKPCARGSYSGNASSVCILCASGKYGHTTGVTECLACDQRSVSPPGAFLCCPHDSKQWPIKTTETLSVPPGKYWTYTHLVPNCDSGVKNGAVQVAPQSSTQLSSGEVFLATLKQGKLHSCVSADCGQASCGVLSPESERLMPGKLISMAAFVSVYNSSNLHQCEEVVQFGFDSVGCESGTVLTFSIGLVAVVSVTMLLGLAFEKCFRRRVVVSVEMSLKVTPKEPAVLLPNLPTLSALQNDVRSALSNAPVPDWKISYLGGWKVDGKQDNHATAVQVDLKLWTPLEYIGALRQHLLSTSWVVGKGWQPSVAAVEAQPPALVREAAKLPGADLLEAAEMTAVKALSCGCGRRSQTQFCADPSRVHMAAAREILQQLMTRWSVGVIAVQALCNVVMIVILPCLGLATMTCAGGFPQHIHFMWLLYVTASSLLTIWLLLRPLLISKTHTRKFFSLFRIRIAFRFMAMIISVTDLYQDATFPVISGRCGFDLWWVSLWLVFLGVGVMQIGVQLVFLFFLRRRYKQARTPEERERCYIEAIFLALRACDNHVIVHAIKPAVEERLGGGSSWTMKTMEARVAFLRFVFEDAEQSALQASFLFFFDQATMADKIWVGLSTGTSLSLSFTLVVQTLPEVRDWLWFQFLRAFPGGVRWPEARILWLLVLIWLYRMISIFPWLGSCTPAGDHDANTLSRLLLISGEPVPTDLRNETLTGMGIAFCVAIMIIIIFLVAWKKPLRLPSRLFLRLCCQERRDRTSAVSLSAGSGRMYHKEVRFAMGGSLQVQKEHDNDTWLESLRSLYTVAGAASSEEAKTLLADIDYDVFRLVHIVPFQNMAAFDTMRADLENRLLQLGRVSLPPDPQAAFPGITVKEATADLIKTMQDEVKNSLDNSCVRARVLSLLSSRHFRRSGLREKARLINDVTENKVPLRLLHSSVLESVGELPKLGNAGLGAEDASALLERVPEKSIIIVYVSHTWEREHHPDTAAHVKAQNLVRFAQWLKQSATAQKMEADIYFWVDYSCVDMSLDIAARLLPLFIAASTQVLIWRTPDFDRRSWPMVERLLAYSFCPGGLTPFAINASSFRVEASKERNEDDDDEELVERFVSGTQRSAQVVPVDTSEAKGWCPHVHRRVLKLPDPTDDVVCRPSFLAAAMIQRRSVKQLVDMALTVPALEVFADRQPVDFGLTEVVEQFLGPYSTLKRAGDAGADGDWLRAQVMSKAPKEWRLEVRRADAESKAHKSLNYGPGDEESTIVIMDRSGPEPSKGVAVPTPAEIDMLFQAVDDAFMEQVSGGSDGSDLEAHAVELVQALQSDLAAAEACGEERDLREALQRLRDVELPSRQRVTEQLCKVQLTNAAASGDIQALHMAMVYATRNGLEDLPELATAKQEHARLRKNQLQSRALKVVSEPNPSVAALLSVLEVAQRRGWDDIEHKAMQVLKASPLASADEALAKLVEMHRLASAQQVHAVIAYAKTELKHHLEEASRRKDASPLCYLMSSADSESLADIAESSCAALVELSEYWKECWQEAQREKAQEGLQKMLSAAQLLKLPKIQEMASEAVQNSTAFENDKHAEATKVLMSGDHTIKDLMGVAKLAAVWGWDDLLQKVCEAWEAKVQAVKKVGVEGVVELLEIQNLASDADLKALADITPPAIRKLIDEAKKAKDATGLMEMAHALEEHGGREFAAHARRNIERLVGALKESGSAEAQKELARLRKAAAQSGDHGVAELAEGAIGAAEQKQKEMLAKIENTLKASSDGVAIVEVHCSATSAGFSDLAEQAESKLVLRIRGDQRDPAHKIPGKASLQEVVQTHEAATKQHAPALVAITSAALKDRVRQAKAAEDAVALLTLSRAVGAGESCTHAGKALLKVVSKWKQANCTQVPEGVKLLADAAKSCGDSELAETCSKLVDLAFQCRHGRDAKDGPTLAGVVRDAVQHNLPGLVRDATQQLQLVVDALKKERDIDALRRLQEATRHCLELKDVHKMMSDCVVLAEQLEGAKATGSVQSLVDVASSARDLSYSYVAKEGCSSLKSMVQALQKDLKSAEKRKSLQAIHDAARSAGLDDVADEAVSAFGSVLPADWKVRAPDGKSGGFQLSKVPDKDGVFISRIQEMLNQTFRGWGPRGPDCITIDRGKTKNPLSTMLKVEEVIHVENTENFLNFMARRDKIKAELQVLPSDFMAGDPHGKWPTDWDIKTRQVSLKGTYRHSEEPVDESINECWLLHGTSEAGVKGITDTDFDMGRAGSATGTLYGAGLYFAESCLKADEYTHADARGWCPILMCRVVLGRVNYCDTRKHDPTALENSCKRGGGFHGVIGDREVVSGTFREFIVFDNDQVYPEYIVWYSRTPPMKRTY